MRRVSWHVSTDAVEAVDQAVEANMPSPGSTHILALLKTAADQADTIAGQLLAERAAHL